VRVGLVQSINQRILLLMVGPSDASPVSENKTDVLCPKGGQYSSSVLSVKIEVGLKEVYIPFYSFM